MAEINRSNIKDKIKFINAHNGQEIQEQDDIREDELKTLGEYLKCITAENEFSIVKADIVKFKLKGSDGKPASISTGNPSAENFSTEGRLEQISDSGDFAGSIKKGTDGHKLLTSIKGSPLDTSGKLDIPSQEDEFKITQKISNVLKRNRFHPEQGTPFVPRGSTGKDIDARSFALSQREYGKHQPTDPNVNFEDLKKVGLALMLKATGEFFGDGDPTNFEAGATSLVPGASQLGATRIDPKSMYAANVFGGTQFQKDEIVSLEQETVLKGSYGALNNHQEPFAGLHPTGMVILANGLVLALKATLEVFARLIGLGASQNIVSNNLGPFPLGRHKNSDRGILGRFSFTDLGIVKTRNQFELAFDAGLDAFFSADALGQSFKRVNESPGFYAILVRAIIRSASEVAEDVSNISGNPFEIAQNVAGVLDNLRRSKIISIVNIFAQIGDNVIELENKGFLDRGLFGDLLTAPEKISTSDRLPDNAPARVGKSRISSNDLTLAWRNSATPSAYVLPDNLLAIETLMPNENNKPSNALRMNGFDSLVSSGRIANEEVQNIEANLDAEYVPFYFHDLRTNEIISFHAFLSSLNDSFNANWESSTPYGRIDPIRIYKNTERQINLEFNVVSTNPTDFDEMWFKINKLVGMLYPQWSEGRKLEVGSDAFIQPFSQIPTSSPVIRLRIGDVIKSNYSRFGLARLFGLGTQNFKLSDQTLDEELANINDENKEEINNVMKRMLRKPLLGDFNSDRAGYQIGEQALLRPSEDIYLQAGVSVEDAVGLLLRHETVVTIKQFELAVGTDISTPAYHVELENPEFFGPDFVGKKFMVRFEDLRPHIKQVVKTALGEDFGLENEATISEVGKFFDPKNNAIVRSFESTSGKGLAGVITNMNFNWQEPTWSTERYGARAPQHCKIGLAFMPIHDLNPGITDIYNVGSVMNGLIGSPYDNDQGKNIFNKENSKLPGFLRPGR